MFHLPNGATAAATKIHKLHHKLRAPARTINIVPSLVGNSLLSTVKKLATLPSTTTARPFFSDSKTAKISVSEAAVLTGYVCPRTQLWCVPLVTTVRNKNTDTLLLNHPHKHESMNAAYTVESTSIMRAHIGSAMSVARGNEYIHNIYKLPSIEPTIRYLHAAAGFPTKESWLRAIWQGNYNSWPLINVKNVAWHFPESEETQKGHMRGQRQGVHSTKMKRWDTDVTSCPMEPSPQITLHIRKGDIMIFDYDLKSRMYTDQTGLFP
jgi:hypothetical protein